MKGSGRLSFGDFLVLFAVVVGGLGLKVLFVKKPNMYDTSRAAAKSLPKVMQQWFCKIGFLCNLCSKMQ